MGDSLSYLDNLSVYTQHKRNAYKSIHNPMPNLIDLPKLYGGLKLIACKNREKVYDKRVDFDTLDLLTKRYNSKKNYSQLSKMLFDNFNRLSEILLHRTSWIY